MVEVDGDYHNEHHQDDYDEGRSYELEQSGIRVIRFTNNEVLENIDAVVSKIKHYG